MKKQRKIIFYAITFDIEEHTVCIISPFLLIESDKVILIDAFDKQGYQIPFKDISNLKIETL